MSSAGGLGPLQEIFEQALGLPHEERGRFLDVACAGDKALRRRVEVMLAADAQPHLYFESAAERVTMAAVVDDAPSRLGPFEILSKIGEGGMGIVYEARQETPRRVVALKVIRPGIVSPEVLRRFQHESEVLGQLQHPGIAQVHAAGMVDGRPWFAMELIHGVPLDAWIVRRAPDVRQRLTLFAAICDAVHHAHEKGIVHRDLKPANVLVDDAGQPKVLDFGVARATGGSGVTATMHTSTGQLVGTLAYMSPEQVGATGGAIDRRSDVYALGVILYEMLAGRLPYQLHGQPMVDALRIIRDEEPSRLSSVSHRFRGDLETIAAKALAKEPGRRYATAAELASDIRRYLNDEPIVARPTSTWYQIRKFTRRNRVLVGGVAGVIVALALGTVVATTFAIREGRQRAISEREAYRSAIAAAAAEIRLNDGGRAAAILDATLAPLRGWEWRYLRRSADRSVRSIEVGGLISEIAISRDGKRVAATMVNGALRVWEIDSGSLVATLPALPPLNRSQIAFSHDGERLFVDDPAAGRTRSIAIDTGAVEWELPYRGIMPLSFSPDGSLVFGTDHGSVVAVDPMTGRERQRWPVHAAATRISYLADGRHVAYLTSGGTQIAELPSWRPIFTASSRTIPTTTGQHVIVELLDHKAQVVDTAGRVVRTSPVWADDLDPLDPERGLTPMEHGVALTDVASGAPDVMLLGHAAKVLWGRYSPDGRRLVTVGHDGTLRIWDAATPPDPWLTRGSASFFAVSPDGRFTVDVGWGSIRLWDARTGWPLWTRMISRRGMNSVAFDAEGRRIVAVGDDGPVFVLDVERGGEYRELARLPVGAFSVNFSTDGSEIMAAGHDGVLRILNASTGSEVRTLGGADASAHFVLPLADGSTIATGGRGPDADPWVWSTGTATARGSGGVRLWNRSTGRLLRTLDESQATVRSLAAGKRRLAVGYADGAISIWDLASGERRSTPATTAAATGLRFDPSEQRLIVGRFGTVEILDVDTLTTIVSLPVPQLEMASAAFSTDGSLIAAGATSVLAVFEVEPTAELYPKRSLARRVERRFELRRRSPHDPDLAAALDATIDRDDPDRGAAIEYARALGINPNMLNSDALSVVRRPGEPRETYELAYRRIRAALPFRPDDLNFLKTLALTQLRLGDYREALATVERAEMLLLAQSQSPRASDLAVRTIAEEALGQHARARESLERLRTVMRSPEEANEIESQAFLVEAERAIKGGRIPDR